MPADSTPLDLPPASAVRPNPDRARAPRLPGTYAANYEGDMNWRRGVAVLWVVFGLLAMGEAAVSAFILLQGPTVYPLPVDAVRLCAESALFLALWAGWGWLRWPLAGINFLYGIWLVIWLIGLHAAAGAGAGGYELGTLVQIGLAAVYLFSAGYIAFSADVLDFLRHRREAGRGWVVAPLALLVGGYLTVWFCAPLIYGGWLGWEEVSARDFTLQSLRAMSSPWDAAAYESRADPEYLDTWYAGDRKNTFANLAPLGAFQQAAHRHMTGATSADAVHGGYVVSVRCDFEPARFVQGRARFSAEVVKTTFGPWKMRAFQMEDIQMDAAPR